MELKICKKCGTEKSVVDFYKHNSTKDKLFSKCISCVLVQQRTSDQHDKINKSNKAKLRYKNKKSDILNKQKQWRNKNWDSVSKRQQKYEKERYHSDVEYKLRIILRKRINKALKCEFKVGSAVKDLGCSISEFKLYIQAQFQPGMYWNNYGKWHIDHVIPLSYFNLSNKEEFLEACNYLNLQPLWAEENIRKSNHVA